MARGIRVPSGQSILWTTLIAWGAVGFGRMIPPVRRFIFGA